MRTFCKAQAPQIPEIPRQKLFKLVTLADSDQVGAFSRSKFAKQFQYLTGDDSRVILLREIYFIELNKTLHFLDKFH